MFPEPGEGRRADPAGDGPNAGDGKMARFADAVFDLDRLGETAPILMCDDRRKRLAAAIHRQPSGGHHGKCNRVDLANARAEIDDSALDRTENVRGFYFSARTGKMRFKIDPSDAPNRSIPAEQRCFDR